ncbi:MAG: cysteine-rich CWC family protein [Rubrivivax sp.]|nr:cysteine-rich CWC family protein [Rubrivivax sp.]
MFPIDKPDSAPLRAPIAADICARCGGPFHCGAQDSTPCACSQLQLSSDLLAQLRQRYTGCLCLACLRKLSAAPATGSCSAP